MVACHFQTRSPFHKSAKNTGPVWCNHIDVTNAEIWCRAKVQPCREIARVPCIGWRPPPKFCIKIHGIITRIERRNARHTFNCNGTMHWCSSRPPWPCAKCKMTVHENKPSNFPTCIVDALRTNQSLYKKKLKVKKIQLRDWDFLRTKNHQVAATDLSDHPLIL